MTRSIFDPGGGETERSGSTFRSEEAANRSRVPPDATDGDVSPVEAREAEAVADADAAGLTPAERIAAIPPDADADALPPSDDTGIRADAGDATPGRSDA